MQNVHESDNHEKAMVHSICIRSLMQISPSILKIAVCICFVLCRGLGGRVLAWHMIENRSTAHVLFIMQAQH